MTFQLRSIELQMPDAQSAVEFLQKPWGLIKVDTRGTTTYLRGTGAYHYVVSVTEGPQRKVISTTMTGTLDEVRAVWEKVQISGQPHSNWVDFFDEPGRGAGFYLSGHDGETFRFIAEQDPSAVELPTVSERPIRLAHVVFNTPSREASAKTLVDLADFKISDRSNRIHFVRCNDLHHVLAYAESRTKRTLNHVAFEMCDTDAVMRGMGRLKDSGHASIWGPGRHGPGNNVFSYFASPFGACIEYTAEIERVDDSYPVGTPESWTWPEGRIDQWGIHSRDLEQLAATAGAFDCQTLEDHPIGIN